MGKPRTTKIDLEIYQGEIDNNIGIFIDEKLTSYEFNERQGSPRRKADGMYGISVTKSQTRFDKFHQVSVHLITTDTLNQTEALKTVREAL